MASKNSKKPRRAITSTQSLSAYVKSICDVMRRSNCASALQYVPELTWILFLRILDQQETRAQQQAEVLGLDFASALRSPYRWCDWAAPWSDADDHPRTAEGQRFGWKRQALFAAGDGRLFEFIDNELLPHLHGLDIDSAGLPNPAASRKQRIIGRIMTAVERVRVDSEANLRDILDRVDELDTRQVDDTHFFTLSQVYEDLWYYDLSQVKVGKKTPLTLAHFGFDADGGVLPDERLPARLCADWRANDETKDLPFPSYARMLSGRGTPAGDPDEPDRQHRGQKLQQRGGSENRGSHDLNGEY